jgi:transcription factor C subunit 7
MAGSNHLYMTRHSARADKEDRKWRPLTGHAFDDTECSQGGNQASQELAAICETIEVSHILSSPFYRCLQTVAPIASAKNIKIKVEPGLCEVLTVFPPGFQDTDQLAQKFDIDVDYKPIMSREQLVEEHSDRSAAARSRRVATILRETLDGPILFCGHGASCLGIGEAFGGSGYVGYSSLSHFSFNGQGWSVLKMGDVSHLSEKLRNQSLSSAW